MTRLSVNVNKVATLRNTRPQLNIPSVVDCAKICLDTGAHGITVHPRPDQRHIRPEDVYDVAELLKSYPDAEFNIEGNPFIDFFPIVEKVRPTQATLVPDTPEAPTSNQGWDVEREGARLGPIVRKLKGLGCRVSLFMDARPEWMEPAAKLGIDRIELYTEPYAAAFARGDANAADAYAATARRAAEVGLKVNAGHDLNLHNLPAFLKAVPQVAEVSIGHALIGDALEFGLAETVRKYLRACDQKT
ncbi:MAG: pyridoxine 5'-phosphate synthase [Tepidisphaeraceae bacterium]